MFGFILTDLAGVPRSELAGAAGKQFSVGVNTLGTSKVGVDAWHPDADFLLSGDALLKVIEVDDDFLRDGTQTLHAHHRLTDVEEVAGADGATVVATFADPFWSMTKRLAGKSPTGYSRGTAGSPVDRGTIVSELVVATNVEGASGLRMGSVTPSSSTYVAGWYYKPIAQAIAELGGALDAYDWRVRPIDYVSAGGGSGLGYYGELDLSPALGTTRLDAAFEYGDGLYNVTGYQRAVTLGGSANRLFHLPPGFPDNTTLAVKTDQDTTAQAAHGLMEDVVAADLSVDDLRTKLLAYHLSVRKGARQTITFTPARALGARVPRLGRSYFAGDVVPLRASIAAPGKADPVKRLDVLVRVYNVTVSVDENGAGTHALTVVPQ